MNIETSMNTTIIETLNTETMNTETMNTETMNTETMNTETAIIETAIIETAIIETAIIKTAITETPTTLTETAINSEKIIIDNFLLNDTNSYVRFPNEDPKKIFSFSTKTLQKIFPNIIPTRIENYSIFDIDVTIDEAKIYKNFLKIFGHQTELSAHDYMEVLYLAEKNSDKKIVEFLYLYIQSQINFQLSCDILDEKYSIQKQYDGLRDIALKIVVKRFESLLSLFNSNTNPNPNIIEYCNAPSYVILEILKHDNLLIDSENSVVYFVMYWINHDKENRKKFFKDFIPYFCFDYMHTNYLLTIFPHVFASLGEDITVYSLPYYTKALTRKWYADSTLSNKRKLIVKDDKIKVVCDFKVDQNFINSLKNNERLYSSTMHTHGYEIFFFFKLVGNKMLSGYLRCITLCQESFNIPVTVELFFVDKNCDNILVLPKIDISFTQNIQGVGEMLIPFESIENQTCNLVRDGALRLKIELTFDK